MLLAVLTGVSCVIWAYLLFFNGWFWLANQVLPDAEEDITWPEVVAVIPARDEAETIGEVVRAHIESDYPGAYSVLIVDDQSSDGTGDIVRAIAEDAKRPVHLVHGTTLPEGWSGKLWAVRNGLKAAEGWAGSAKYVLLTDADIAHAPDTLQKLVYKAETENRVLVSVMARLDTRGFWGGLLIPAFIFYFQKLYPFPSTNQDSSRIAGAAGGCMLIDWVALRKIGGVDAIKDTLIDDCSLAYELKNPKQAKRSIWLGFDDGVISLRDNRALSTIWKMVARTAFTQLHFSALLLIGTMIGMVLTYLIAPFTLLTYALHQSDLAFTLAVWAWVGSMIAYIPTLIRCRKNPLWLFLLPIAGLLYSAMTVSSALNHWRGAGGNWKGRTYS